MRIAYVCVDPGVPVFGQKGCSVHVQELIRAFVKQGAHIDLFSNRVKGDRPAGLENINVHKLPALPPKEEPVARERAALDQNDRLLKELQQRGPFDFVYERYWLWNYSGMEYAKTCGIPGILEVNAPLIEEEAKHRTLADRNGAEKVASQVFQAASSLVAVSEEVAGYLERYRGSRQGIHVIPNAINPERFANIGKRQEPRSKKTFTVGFLGTLKPWHGVSNLVEAFALLRQKLPASRLLIVGDGPQRASLAQDIESRGLSEWVEMPGAVSPSEVPQWLASMDVGTAPYPAMDDFYFSPLKVYEYMASGLPVVASRIGQLEQMIQHETSGLLCPPGDPAALADSLRRIHDDSELWKRLGETGRAAVMENHTWDGVANRIFEITGCPIAGTSALKTKG